MFTLRIEHQIHGFAMWKGAFDRLIAIRERAGVRNHRVFCPVDDPNYVLIDLDFEHADAAEGFLAVAVVLGPCTLARPAVLVIAAAAGGWTASGSVRAVALLGAVALVAVEPLLGRRARSIPPAGLPAGGMIPARRPPDAATGPSRAPSVERLAKRACATGRPGRPACGS